VFNEEDLYRVYRVIDDDGNRAEYPAARQHALEKPGKPWWKQPPDTQQQPVQNLLIFDELYDSYKHRISVFRCFIHNRA
jgi:hypothetical protein